MMLRLGMAATALLGSLALSATPAQAALVEVCDPVLNGVCVLVLTDPGEGCPPGYLQVAGAPIPATNRSVVKVCALA